MEKKINEKKEKRGKLEKKRKVILEKKRKKGKVREKKEKVKRERNEWWITIVIYSVLSVGEQRFPNTLKKIK